MFRCEVTNYGYVRKTFPTRKGNLFLDRLRPLVIEDRGVYVDLKRFEASDKLGFQVVVDDENGRHPARSEKSGIDYVAYSINELRSIATGKGIKGAFFLRKADLIKKLEEDKT